MTFVLVAYGLVAVIAFLVIWRGFGADLSAALLMAVLGTAGLAAVIYVLADLGHYL